MWNPLRRLVTFPDAAGKRWSVYRPIWRTKSRWHRVVLAVALGLWLLSLSVRLGFLAFMLWKTRSLYDSPEYRATYLEFVGTFLWNVAVTVLAVGFVFLVVPRFCTGRKCRTLLRKDRCPSCGYSLRDLTAAPRLTCPECGAVWNRPSPA
jgi:hypothetical protein